MYNAKEAAAPRMVGGPTGCTPPPIKDIREVERAMNDLDRIVERYGMLVGILHDRLSTVTTPSAPTECNREKESGYCTSLASAINSIHCKLRDITDNLENLSNRIEL